MSYQRVRTQATIPRPPGEVPPAGPRMVHVSHCSRLLAPLLTIRREVRSEGRAGGAACPGLASVEELQAGA